MKQRVLLDTGPLVALLKHQDQFHDWVTGEWSKIQPPLLTCEAVIAEACFLVRDVYGGQQSYRWSVGECIQIPFRLDEKVDLIRELLARYQSVPMSLADACLVRMTEQYPESLVLTFDSDFEIYRKNRKQVIPVIMPKVES